MKIPFFLLFVSHTNSSLLKSAKRTRTTSSSITEMKIVPNSESQQKYADVLKNADIPVVVGVGPAGSGKTHLACDAFVDLFERGIYKRLILTRPSVKVEGEDFGFIPGSLSQKMDPWIQPIYEILGNYYTKTQLKKMIDSNVIDVVPLAYMRGRSFHQSFVLADEMQNATPAQLKMLLTRLGKDSKMVLTGDLEQSDLTSGVNGLQSFVQRYIERPLSGAEMVQMKGEDVQRSPFVRDFLQWW